MILQLVSSATSAMEGHPGGPVQPVRKKSSSRTAVRKLPESMWRTRQEAKAAAASSEQAPGIMQRWPFGAASGSRTCFKVQ